MINCVDFGKIPCKDYTDFIGVLTHGSEDSLDTDIFIVYDKYVPINDKDACALCARMTQLDYNANVIKVDKEIGQVMYCFKGTRDEVNNSILHTYSLHEQSIPCPITTIMERDIYMKVVRVMRCLISYCSRQPNYRPFIKTLQKTGNLKERLDFIETMEYNNIITYYKNPIIEVHKSFAFQLGQVIGLMDGYELYTKSSVSNAYPELEPFLYRKENADVNVLCKYIKLFVTLVREMDFPSKLNIVKEKWED